MAGPAFREPGLWVCRLTFMQLIGIGVQTRGLRALIMRMCDGSARARAPPVPLLSHMRVTVSRLRRSTGEKERGCGS